jgi:hypothetical protein
MATVASRAALRQTIAQRSKNCQPQAATPTYDALRQALTMLKRSPSSLCAMDAPPQMTFR